MAIFLQDLDQRFPIVDADGKPTDYFMRLLRGQTGELADGLTDTDALVAALQVDVSALEGRNIDTGFGLSGGGDLSADRTIALGNPALADPNADRILFWDDSAGQMQWLEAGSNLSISGTTISATGGSSGGGVWSDTTGLRREWRGVGTVGAGRDLGLLFGTTGTAVNAAVATTNRLTRGFRSTLQSATANAGFGWVGDAYFRADGNYIMEAVAGFNAAPTISEKRLFVGVRASGTLSTGDPSALANTIGVGADTADANWQIMHNDGAGTATKIDTGIAKAVGDVLYVRIEANSTDAQIKLLHFAAANLTMTPTTTVTQTVSTNIPAATANMAIHVYGVNGATAETTNLSASYMSLTSPF